MSLEAFNKEDVYFLVSSFIAGYGILFILSPGYLLSLTDLNIIIQSTALGLSLTAVISFPAKFIIEDSYYESKAEKLKDNFNKKFELIRVFGGSLLVVLGMLI